MNLSAYTIHVDFLTKKKCGILFHLSFTCRNMSEIHGKRLSAETNTPFTRSKKIRDRDFARIEIAIQVAFTRR